MIVTKNRASLEYFKKFWWGMPKSVIFIVVFSLLLAQSAIQIPLTLLSYLFTGEGAGYLIGSLAFLALEIYWLVRLCRMPHRFYAQSQKLSPNIMETMYFNEYGFSADNVGEHINEHVEYSYDRVTRAFYKDGWFFIYCDKARGYVMHSSSFVQGSPQELMNLLGNRLGNKFKVK